MSALSARRWLGLSGRVNSPRIVPVGRYGAPGNAAGLAGSDGHEGEGITR
jgi:hypothetical protein